MARSMTNQVALIQKEVTPGTPLVTAMKRLLGLRFTPGYATANGQGFKAAGHKVDTSYQIGDLWGAWGVDGIQDFNVLGYVLTSLFGPPVTTTPATGVNTRKHVFTPLPAAADPLVTYTAQWGDTTKAFQSAYFVFNSLSLGVQRGQLSFGSSGLSRVPDKAATLATTGVTDVPSQPIPQRSYDVFSDATWAALGTTKLLAVYEANINHGDKYVGDTPINSAISAFETLLENEDIKFDGNIRVGFDTAGAALVDTYTTEALKFLRFSVLGPLIETTLTYFLTFDICVRITNVGSVAKAANSPAVTLPFDFEWIKDPTSGFFAVATLQNTVVSY